MNKTVNRRYLITVKETTDTQRCVI